MATLISALLIPCLKSFNQLQERVEQPDYGYEREVSSASWGDELGRLRVWAANIGAHQTGQSSLDFRLRDASHISNQITKLLQDLNRSLDDVLDELLEDGTEASEDDGTSASWLGDNSTTEFQQLHEEVVNIIDCLYQLSMLIRKPAQHDLLVGSRMGDKVEFEFYDNEHVRNLHPRTEEQISQRLGRAITRRRKYLGYRERHHRKLEKGIEQTTSGSTVSETIATDFKTQNIDFEDTSSNSGMSQTSYAPSLIDGGRVTIPAPPKQSAEGKPFECPYCYFVIDIKSERSWIRHIFKDIKPYVCTFADCSMPDRVYDSRREWYFHETTEHHREDLVCALCKDTLKSSKQYERHVARHLEELALFALPRTELDDPEDDDDDVVDARASTSEKGVTVDTAHSSDHSDHSSLASVTDDEDSTGTNVQVRPREDNDDDVVDARLNVEYPDELVSSEASTAQHGSVPPEQSRLHQPQKPIDEAIANSFDRESIENVPPELIDQTTQNVIKPLQTPGGLHSTSHKNRSPSPDSDYESEEGTEHLDDYELERKMKLLEKLEEKEKEDIARENFEEGLLLSKAKKAKKKKEEQELKQKAIEEYYIKKLEDEVKKGKEKKETDEEFKERVKKTFNQAGYDDESIEKILKKGENGDRETKIEDLARPVFIKVHQKHISPETLNEYSLPWEWDQVSFHLAISNVYIANTLPARFELHRHQAVDSRSRSNNPL